MALNGALLLFAQHTGAGLTVTNVNANTRKGSLIENGIIAYAGTAASVTGLRFIDTSQPSVRNVRFINFNTPFAVALLLDNAEEGYLEKLFFSNNTIATKLTRFANHTIFMATTWDHNVQAVEIT